jgi:regulator of cell morphogenesis and NO signaling
LHPLKEGVVTDVHDLVIGDIVAEKPAAARVFDAYGLDYCCHGDRTLEDSCGAVGVDPSVVVDMLEHVTPEGDNTWTSMGLRDLTTHIVAVHHAYLKRELPALEALAAKVLAAHGERHPELADVHRLVIALRADLEPHLLKEERVLFPAIAALVDGQTEFPFGSIRNPIRMMTFEHENAGELLTRLRAVTGGYAMPRDGCASYRSLYHRLAALELDTHLHIHKENHVLFPAAQRLER